MQHGHCTRSQDDRILLGPSRSAVTIHAIGMRNVIRSSYPSSYLTFFMIDHHVMRLHVTMHDSPWMAKVESLISHHCWQNHHYGWLFFTPFYDIPWAIHTCRIEYRNRQIVDKESWNQCCWHTRRSELESWTRDNDMFITWQHIQKHSNIPEDP